MDPDATISSHRLGWMGARIIAPALFTAGEMGSVSALTRLGCKNDVFIHGVRRVRRDLLPPGAWPRSAVL